MEARAEHLHHELPVEGGALSVLAFSATAHCPAGRAGLAFSAVVSIAFAAGTVSIAIMEMVDNAIMLAIPGAMEASLENTLFWGSLSVALVVAGMIAYPFNRWMIARGKGHAVVHQSGLP